MRLRKEAWCGEQVPFLSVRGRKRRWCEKKLAREDVCSPVVSEGMDASMEYQWRLDSSKAEKTFIVVIEKDQLGKESNKERRFQNRTVRPARGT